MYLHDILKRLWSKFVLLPHLRVCLDLFHLVPLLTIYDIKRIVVLTVTHTFMGNRPKLADWSKWICITL